MRPSQSRLAATIIAGLFVAVACAPVSDPFPVVTPTASPSIRTMPSDVSAAPAATVASPIASPRAAPSATPTPTPTPAPTPVPVPPKPTGVTFDQQIRETDDGEVATITQSVTWGAPRRDGVEIRVYGVTSCIAMPASPSPGANGPCLVEHTPLPASARTLLATAPAPDGRVSWTWTEAGHECGEPLLFYDHAGPAYLAVVLAAYGPSGHSIFVMAEPGGWWEPAAGDIIC